MEEVRNSANKLVCKIDKSQKLIEIVIKNCKTTIKFLDNGDTNILSSTTIA